MDLRCEGSTALAGKTGRRLTGIGEIERWLLKLKNQISPPSGAIAQLGEHIVRNDEVVGSIPTSSTNLLNGLATIAAISVNRRKPTYWNVFDRESTVATFANSESCSSARSCGSGTIRA